ncbi:MAG: hypothetical protein H7329_13010 [Opitutaceae bacterium]|nr:hypothetical protein [Cytophagales bacterium]
MKKILTALLISGLFVSCQKKEQSSTELENAKMDAKDANADVKEYTKVGVDSMAQDVKEQSKAKDGFEGKQSQY